MLVFWPFFSPILLAGGKNNIINVTESFVSALSGTNIPVAINEEAVTSNNMAGVESSEKQLRPEAAPTYSNNAPSRPDETTWTDI